MTFGNLQLPQNYRFSSTYINILEAELEGAIQLLLTRLAEVASARLGTPE